MHVLTKIFIVLVSLLAILLVPLVVVYAYNENNFKARYLEAESKALTAMELVKTTEARAGLDLSKVQTEAETFRRAKEQLTNDKTAADVTIRQLESQVATASAMQSAITGDIATIKSTVAASQQLTDSLVNEIRELRASAVTIEKQKVELDQALASMSSQLEVAEQARRALQEEVVRLKDENSRALTKLGLFIGKYGDSDVRAGAVPDGVMPDRNITAKIIRVERSAGQVLAEIDAGSRDGVKENWSMTISKGGDFVAKLRIINVDINRATGVISLEDSKRGLVQVGQSAHAFAGQN